MPNFISEDTIEQLCYISPETVVLEDHPLRGIKTMGDIAMKKLSTQFDAM